MTTGGLITAVLNHYDNVDASDSDNTNRRARVLQYAQEVFDNVYYYREWPWRYASSTITLNANQVQVKLPATFQQFGVQGSVNKSSDGMKLDEVAAIDIYPAQYQLVNNPSTFTILFQDATDGLPYIQFGGTVGSNTDYDITYLQTSPALVDATDNTSKLQFIPVAYHNTVLMPGVVSRIKQSEGDQRNWEDRFQDGLAKMVQDERPFKTAVRRMPLTVNMW